MRFPTPLLIPAALLALLAAGCDRGIQVRPANIPSYAAGHPLVRAEPFAVTPPRATPAYTQASSGPGTDPRVPTGVQPDVVSFIDQELGLITQLINDGRLERATLALDGLDFRRSSWSLATQQALAPKIAATRKSLEGAVRPGA